MSIPTYTDLPTMKDRLGISQAKDDAKITAAISAASRAVDSFCQRRFWLDPAPVARTFVPQTLLDLEMDDDIGSTDGLQVVTDPSGDGNFDVTWDYPRDFQLLPQNAPFAYPEPKPWTQLRAVGTLTFPWLVNTWLTRLDRVQITARWGWPEVPDAVVEATKIKAARLFHRKDSPQGVAGFGEFGVVRLSAREDVDVILLLTSYARQAVLVG